MSYLGTQLCIPVTEESQVGLARRSAATLAGSHGFDDSQTGRVSVVASELARNLATHGKDGRLFLQALQLPSGVLARLRRRVFVQQGRQAPPRPQDFPPAS